MNNFEKKLNTCTDIYIRVNNTTTEKCFLIKAEKEWLVANSLSTDGHSCCAFGSVVKYICSGLPTRYRMLSYYLYVNIILGFFKKKAIFFKILNFYAVSQLRPIDV